MDSNEIIYKLDGLGNIINQSTGLGTNSYDTFSDYGIRFNSLLSNDINTLDELYTKSWQCGKVVEYLPQMMIKSWGQVNFEDNSKLPRKLKRQINKLKKIYLVGQTFGNLYGQSYIVRYVDDGRPFDKPINWNNVNSVSYSRIYTPTEISPHYNNFVGNYYDPTYYEFFAITPEEELKKAKVYDNDKSYFLIHKDRILTFSGVYLPPRVFEANTYRHGSVLDRFLTPYNQFVSSLRHTSKALESFEVYILAIDQLFEKIATGGSKTEQSIINRLQIFNKSLSSMRAGVRDKEKEDISILARNFTNIDKILDQLRTEMIAASGLTKPQFYQEHPSGLAATGQSERMAEANAILALQDNKWGECIYDDIDLLMFANNITKDYDWEWLSVYQETPEEKSDRKYKNAQSDAIYTDRNILTREETRQRFTGINYSDDIYIIEDTMTKDTKETTYLQDTSKEEKILTKFNQDNSINRFVPLEDEINQQNIELASIEIEDLENIE